MKKILLLTVAMLSATTAYSACTPPIGKCDCAFPKFENGALTCGESYCKEKTCMPNGSCCTTPNNTKTECCDNYNNGVAKDGTCCPALETAGCETEVDTETGCYVCKKQATLTCLKSTYKHCSVGGAEWCCNTEQYGSDYECGSLYTCVRSGCSEGSTSGFICKIDTMINDYSGDLDGSGVVSDFEKPYVTYYSKENGEIGGCRCDPDW